MWADHVVDFSELKGLTLTKVERKPSPKASKQ